MALYQLAYQVIKDCQPNNEKIIYFYLDLLLGDYQKGEFDQIFNLTKARKILWGLLKSMK